MVDLQESLYHLEGLSSGPLVSVCASSSTVARRYFEWTDELGMHCLIPHLQATLDMLKVGIQDDSEKFCM